MILRTPALRPSARIGAEGLTLVQQAADYYQSLLARLRLPSGAEAAPRVVGVTSALRGEGVSTIVANLALTAAVRGGMKVLLVDANLQNPVIDRLFGLDPAPGFLQLLRGHDETHITQPTTLPGLCAVTSGGRIDNPLLTIDPLGLAELVREWRSKYDLVLLDLPPTVQATWSLSLAAALDGLLLVVEADKTPWDEARRAKQLLEQVSARLLGVVLNKRAESMPRWLRRE